MNKIKCEITFFAERRRVSRTKQIKEGLQHIHPHSSLESATVRERKATTLSGF